VNVAVIDYRSRVAPSALAESLRATGFAVIVAHPLDPELVRLVQEEWLAFFDGTDKWDYVPDPGAQDGYNPLDAKEVAVGATLADIKEFFHWYPWGRQPPALHEATAQLYRDATALGATLLGWLQAPPGAGLHTVQRAPTRHARRLSPHHVAATALPPVTGQEPPGSLRAAAHEDIDLLTVLPAATQPGLQVQDLQGRWHDVACDPGGVVVNGGDMLTLASGGFFPSTTHRVLLPSVETATPRECPPRCSCTQPTPSSWRRASPHGMRCENACDRFGPSNSPIDCHFVNS